MISGPGESGSAFSINRQKMKQMASPSEGSVASKRSDIGIDRVNLTSLKGTKPGIGAVKQAYSMAASKPVLAVEGVNPAPTQKQAALGAYKAMQAYGD